MKATIQVRCLRALITLGAFILFPSSEADESPKPVVQPSGVPRPVLANPPAETENSPSVGENSSSPVKTPSVMVKTPPVVVKSSPVVVKSSPVVVKSLPAAVKTPSAVLKSLPAVVDTPSAAAKSSPAVVEKTPAAQKTPPGPVNNPPAPRKKPPVKLEKVRPDTQAVSLGKKPVARPDVFEVKLRLIRKSKLPANLNGRTLAVYEYEVLEEKGTEETLLVADGVFFQGKLNSVSRREVGAVLTLKLTRLNRYPLLRNWATVNDFSREDPIYTPVLE